MNWNRIYAEEQVLKTLLNPSWVVRNGAWIYIYNPKGNREFTLQFDLSRHPNALPRVCVDRMLYDFNGNALDRPIGCHHTLGPIDGKTQICHMSPLDWNSTISVWFVYLRCSAWLDAYLYHIDTGTPIDYFLKHRA